MCLQRTGVGPDTIRAAPIPRDSSVRPEQQRQHDSTDDRHKRQTPADVVFDLGSSRRGFAEHQHVSPPSVESERALIQIRIQKRPDYRSRAMSLKDPVVSLRNAFSPIYGTPNCPNTDHAGLISRFFRHVSSDRTTDKGPRADTRGPSMLSRYSAVWGGSTLR